MGAHFTMEICDWESPRRHTVPGSISPESPSRNVDTTRFSAIQRPCRTRLAQSHQITINVGCKSTATGVEKRKLDLEQRAAPYSIVCPIRPGVYGVISL